MLVKDLKNIINGADDNASVTFDGKICEVTISIIKTYKKSIHGAFENTLNFEFNKASVYRDAERTPVNVSNISFAGSYGDR